MQITKLIPTDTAYPQRLTHLSDPPQAIYVMGDSSLLKAEPSLAIIGSRRMTPYGQGVTCQLATAGAERGIVVISGLALGIDAQAHKAALGVGGRCIAVLASGLDIVTPSTNEWLAREILTKGGAIVSEYPPGIPALKYHFIARNRIIAALSQAVLITQAAVKSGSLHTARFALDIGRTVMAVPGPVNDPQSAGTNNLLKSGALLVTGAADVFQALNMDIRSKRAYLPSNPEQATIFSLIGKGVTKGEELHISSRLEIADFNRALTMLEINGHIHALGNNHWGLHA